MAQLKRYNGTSWETIGGVVTGDTLPIGSEVDYDGASAPAGWEEISNDLVVDSIKTKNMFDGIIEQGSYAYADGSKSPSSNYVRSTNKISVEAGKTYTLSYTSSIANNSGFVFFNNGTYVGSQNGGTTVTIPSGANQVVFNLGAWPNNITPSDVSNVQFEEGETVTEYRPYQNLNGEEYYSVSETRIGTWIDGKPLYRKTLTFPNGNSGSTAVVAYTLSDYGISNVSTIFIVHPSYYSNSMSGATYPFQYNDGTAFECNVNTTKLNVKLGYQPISNSPFVITLEYTKTTD